MPHTYSRLRWILAQLLCAGSLAACGGGGNSTPPNASISANSSSIVIGASTSLTWSSSNAGSCTLGGSGVGTGVSVSTSASAYSVTPADAGVDTYTLQCTGSGGTTSQTTTVNVTPSVSVQLALPTGGGGASLTMTTGTSTYLSWSSQFATSCTASGAWSGSLPSTGPNSMVITAQSPGLYNYTLTCQNAGGSTAATATLTVTPALSVSIGSQSQAYTQAMLGQPASVSWSTTGATACTLGGDWSGTAPVTGTQAVSPTSVGRYTYTITCTGGGQSIVQSAMLTVTPSLSIGVSPASIPAGQSATLTWTTSGATSCTAPQSAWFGTQALNGNTSVSPTTPGSYSYYIQCGDSQGDYSYANTTLTVTPNGFAQTNLVATATGTSALAADPNLVNPWGVALMSSPPQSPGSQSLPAVVANEQSNTSTSYDGMGSAPAAGTFLVHLPTGSGPTPFNPTGVVFNSSGSGFAVGSGSGTPAPAQLIYVGESGMIAAWAATVDPSNAYTTYTDTGGAEYTGATLANGYLYAADFHNGKIDVFDSAFNKQTPSATSYAFSDPTLPAGYAPYGIWAISGVGNVSGIGIYVAYAQQVGPANRTAAVGAGLGVVDVFSDTGVLLGHLIAAGGALNAPWQITVAQPPLLNLGSLTGTLLIGNSGDGTINAFNASNGAPVGTVSDASGTAIAVPGLKGFLLGDNYNNQAGTALFFAAGSNAGTSGLYGRLDFGAVPRLHTAPVVAVSTVEELHVNDIDILATVTDSVGLLGVYFYGCAPPQVAVGPYQAECVGPLPSGQHPAATAIDVDGNVTTTEFQIAP